MIYFSLRFIWIYVQANLTLLNIFNIHLNQILLLINMVITLVISITPDFSFEYYHVLAFHPIFVELDILYLYIVMIPVGINQESTTVSIL